MYALRFARAICLAGVLSFSASAISSAQTTSVDDGTQPSSETQVLRLRFEQLVDGKVPADPEGTLAAGRVVGAVQFDSAGPRPERFPKFEPTNHAAKFSSGTSIRFADPGANSVLDFGLGDSMTLEAWVAPAKLANGQQIYVVGKGRTKNEGFAAENQNYALRLSGDNGQACVSFLFRNARNRPGKSEDFHRWTSTSGFTADGNWHHIAVTYTFGKSESVRGYLDGKPVNGKWDYGGATNEGPVVDNDELWIGSALGGNPGNTFEGLLDEIAIHREALPASTIAARYVFVRPPSYVTTVPERNDVVLCEVMEGIPDQFSWDFAIPKPTDSWSDTAFGMFEIPHKYNSHGVRTDRTNPFLVRMTGRFTFPEGKSQLLLRSRNGARLFVDGKQIVENPFPKVRGDGHSDVYDIKSDVSPNIRPPQTGDSETVATIEGDGKSKVVTLEVFTGGKKHRPEFGETGVWIERADGMFHLLSGTNHDWPLTDEGWADYVQFQTSRLDAFNRENRQKQAAEYTAYWNKRHAQSRQLVEDWKPISLAQVTAGMPQFNEIDHFVNARLAEAGASQLPLTDDWAFLRRVALDVIGTVPPKSFAEEFISSKESDRRAKLIDRLLDQPGWADHWVGYWQDVLAENPNIVNPTLNNTGPFRWWLHESFRDNKPFDRFATELILMEGSTHFGGPAGFGLATQNDSPMAAKAHVLAQAFLGMEMKCARCHDAPYHDFTQRDLFSLAAMLKRSEEKVPKTSTIPGDKNAVASLLVKVTLKPGEAIPPEWPFADELSGKLSTDILLNPQDQREQLAALVTAPTNRRFAQVIVNRIWQRYLGRGLVEPIDDWEHAEPSHPELLEYLERELIRSGYDLKHVARLILNSHVYQRRSDSLASGDSKRAALFAGTVPRRLSAEQLVDSLFTAVGKPFNVEEMSVDVDSQRSFESSLSMGVPQRSWQFASLSNERDRPALTLPAALTITNLLETFGWRASRPDPLSVRPVETTVLQPAILSNGVAAKRISQLSDDSAITTMALKDQPLVDFIDDVYRTMLTRPATSEEREIFRELLQQGYDSRRVDAPIVIPRPPKATGVTWSNHLKPEASDRKLALAKELEKGDPPTQRLRADWRERAEDFVWTLINSPEFVFVP